MMSVCKIKVGTHIVIGPGQSADCSEGLSYAKSSANQVFIPNNSAENVIFVEDCHDTPTQAEEK